MYALVRSDFGGRVTLPSSSAPTVPAPLKGEPLGGAADEWVVIEPAYRAVELATRLSGAKTALAGMAPGTSVETYSIATTEGYAARPGGSQARFHAEMAAEELKQNEKLAVAAYRDFQDGVLPAEPGARY